MAAFQKENPIGNSEVLLTLKQACDVLNCHANTLRKWDKTGLLVALRVGKRGDRRYKQKDVLKFLEENNFPQLPKTYTQTSTLDLQRYKAIIESSDDAITAKTAQGIVTHWNPAAERLYGYTKKEIIGKSITTIIPPELRGEHSKLMEKLRKGKKIHHYETTRRRKNGERVEVSISISPIKDAEGIVVGATTITRNITELKKSKELKVRLEQQAVVAELGLQSLSEIDLKEFMNQVVETLAQTLKVEYTKILELLPSGKEVILRAGVGWKPEIVVDQSTVDTGKNSQAGYTLQSKRPVIVHDLRTEKRFNGPPLLRNHRVVSGMSVIIQGRKKPYGVLGIHTTKKRVFTKDDVNFLQAIANLLALTIERHRSKQELSQTLHDLENVRYALNQSSIVAVTDRAGMILEVNDKFVEISKYDRKELVGKTHRVINSKFHDKKFWESMWNTILSGKVWRGEIKNQAKDGSFYWVDTTITPLTDEKGKPQQFIAIRNDITRRKNLEQLKDEFIALASHELKTPVTSIKAYGQILHSQFKQKGDEKSAELMNKLDRQVDRITSLISDLLDVTKIQAGKLKFDKETYDFNDLVREVAEEIQRTTDKHTIELKLDKTCHIQGDRDRTGQVISNFLSNAVKYSPDSTKVVVKSSVSNNHVHVCVVDRGIGIPKEKQERIFERFYRVDDQKNSAYSGLGIGLYICREIIERQNGKISFSSNEAKGSTFCFELPIRAS